LTATRICSLQAQRFYSPGCQPVKKSVKKLLPLLLSLIVLVACKKENKESSEQSGKLVGKWKLVQMLFGPGNGTADWHTLSFAQQLAHPIVIQFKQDGSFESSEMSNEFNRYSVTGIMVSLYSSLDSARINLPLSIQELNGKTFAYYEGRVWRDGPIGRKFIRQ